MKRLIWVLLGLFLISDLALATYEDEAVTSEGSGYQEVGIGIFSALVRQALKSRPKEYPETPTPLALPPPPPVTIAEIEVSEELDGEAVAEIEVKKGNSIVVVKAPVFLPRPEKKEECCEFTSLEITNIWNEDVEVILNYGDKNSTGDIRIPPGGSHVFNQNLGECVRITVKSSTDRQRLLVEDHSPAPYHTHSSDTQMS